MGRFTGHYLIKQAKVPYRLKIYVEHVGMYTRDFDEDKIYVPPTWVDGIGWDTLAEESAIDTAWVILKNGMRSTEYNVFHPAHKIERIKLVKCEWQLEMVEVSEKEVK
jgi:hypothetical protein